MHHDEARAWLRDVYQGDQVRQLSVRSVVSGMLIGAVMSISNLYVGLKTGWGLGVTITACIIAYGVFRALEAVVPHYRRNPFSILENNTMSSAASAAGYIASAGLTSAFPALYLTTGRLLTWWEMIGWLLSVSILGVFMAVPLKRQLINIDKLPFPSGIATAETLRSMHSASAESLGKARSLVWGAGIGAVVAFWRDGLGQFGAWLATKLERPSLKETFESASFPENIPLFPGGGSLLERYSIGFEGSLIMIAAGAIMGIRVGVSLLLGSALCYCVIAPILLDQNIVEPGYKGIVSWTLWPATSLMVTSSMVSLGLKWRTIVRAMSGLKSAFSKDPGPVDPLAHIEVPTSWFVWGTLVAGGAAVYLGHAWFGITWWMGILAVVMTFFLAIVAARATGETDVTPIGAMGKITQLSYGIIAPSNMTTNLMTASITAGASSHAADLLTDLKAGYLLGANPRRQTIAQLFGVVAGSLLAVPVYTIVVKPELLGTAAMPAPSAKVWAGVAKMLASGVSSLPAGALVAMIVGAVLGVLLALGEVYLPERYRKWLPSATGLGIAGVIPAFNCLSMFIGSFLAWRLMKKKPETADRYLVTVSSGLIAGESLMGVAIILAAQGSGMIQEIMKAFTR
ncbi:MAG: hypothetical protein RL011_245 [Pseudomonadota bacterium]|jgi:uncharacterized oligopeptide transporter (OPT) family protein